MIAPLRRCHRWLTATLLLAVPVLLALALAARPPEPRVEPAPAVFAPPAPSGAAAETLDVFDGIDVAVRTWRLPGGAVLEIAPAEPLARPAVLAYWTATRPDDRLPGDAILLGAVADHGRTYAVPAAAAGRDGHLVLYSLGHQEVVASGALPALGVVP